MLYLLYVFKSLYEEKERRRKKENTPVDTVHNYVHKCSALRLTALDLTAHAGITELLVRSKTILSQKSWPYK
jgi:hypothetical protein